MEDRIFLNTVITFHEFIDGPHPSRSKPKWFHNTSFLKKPSIKLMEATDFLVSSTHRTIHMGAENFLLEIEKIGLSNNILFQRKKYSSLKTELTSQKWMFNILFLISLKTPLNINWLNIFEFFFIFLGGRSIILMLLYIANIVVCKAIWNIITNCNKTIYSIFFKSRFWFRRWARSGNGIHNFESKLAS